MKKEKPGQIGKSKIKVIEKNYDWGLYLWVKPNGKVFGDGQGNLLNITSRRGDLQKMAELKRAAEYYGCEGGHAQFHPGVKRISDLEYSEQVSRMKEGLIPNMNDLGAVHAAQQTLKMYGEQE